MWISITEVDAIQISMYFQQYITNTCKATANALRFDPI